jgi:pimeloyl-ACP methyl ester carboxylesterase
VVKRGGAARLGFYGVWAMTAFFAAGIATLHAEDVTTEHQGLDVLGNLEIAQGKTLKTDGAVLIVHGSLGHNRMEIISAAQELLRERGINSLAITLSLGLDQRRGMFDCSLEQDHRHDDAIDEIETWVNWLKEKGASTITLAGHDRGASQAAAYAGHAKADRAVRRLVLFAPLLQTFDDIDRDYFQRYKKVLRDELSRAEQLVSQDEASTLMDGVGFLECPNAKVTAGAFADYYSNNQKFFTPSLLPSVKISTLVVGGGGDPLERELSMAMRDLGGQKNIVFEEVQSADHFFRDASADELADRIKDFLGRKMESAAVASPPSGPQPQGVKMKTHK